MTEPEEVKTGYEDPDNFPDFDEVDSETIEEDEDAYDPTEVDPETDEDEGAE